MKHFVFSSLLGITLACFAQTAFAEMVAVGFEEFYTSIESSNPNAGSPDNPGWSWNGTSGRDHSGEFPNGFLTSTGKTDIYDNPGYTYQSKGVTFSGYYSSYAWSGIGLSTVTDATFNSFNNEMASASGTGNGGSKTYAVLYGDSTNNLPFNSDSIPSIYLPADALIQSMAISNTVYLQHLFSNGAPNGFSTPMSQVGDYMSLFIYGVNAAGELIGTVEQMLGEYTDENGLFSLSDWTPIDLSDLQGATELRFAFSGNDLNGDWLNPPAYIAFDDIVYSTKSTTPEPATLAILGLGLAGLGLVRRRK